MNEPRRGEVWIVDLGMAAKVRPCLVISIGATDEDRALATVVPHTTSARNSRFEVRVKVNFLREGVSTGRAWLQFRTQGQGIIEPEDACSGFVAIRCLRR